MKIKTKQIGYICLGVAFLLFISDITELISRWKNWEITNLILIGEIFKRIGEYSISAIGGKMLPQREWRIK